MNTSRESPIAMRLCWLCAPAFLILASCSSTQPYPDQWMQPERGRSIGECPMISGVYHEYGEVPGGCQTFQKPCSSLSYSLLSGGVGYKEFFDGGESNWPGFHHAKVRLIQPAERTLEVEMLDNSGQPVHRESLSMDDGEFSCDGKYLKLKGRPIAAAFGISNIFGAISRSFGLGRDGSLIMESKESVVGNHTVVPLMGTHGVWVRWSQIE